MRDGMMTKMEILHELTECGSELQTMLRDMYGYDGVAKIIRDLVNDFHGLFEYVEVDIIGEYEVLDMRVVEDSTRMKLNLTPTIRVLKVEGERDA